jgi:hypothetical protein
MSQGSSNQDVYGGSAPEVGGTATAMEAPHLRTVQPAAGAGAGAAQPGAKPGRRGGRGRGRRRRGGRGGAGGPAARLQDPGLQGQLAAAVINQLGGKAIRGVGAGICMGIGLAVAGAIFGRAAGMGPRSMTGLGE